MGFLSKIFGTETKKKKDKNYSKRYSVWGLDYDISQKEIAEYDIFIISEENSNELGILKSNSEIKIEENTMIEISKSTKSIIYNNNLYNLATGWIIPPNETEKANKNRLIDFPFPEIKGEIIPKTECKNEELFKYLISSDN